MKRNILLKVTLMGILFTQLTFAQRSFSSYPEREIIVHFNVDVLTHRQQATSGTLADFSISSSVLHRSLDSAKVESIGALVPNFKKEDRDYLTRNGRNVTISDWSKTFIIRIPENGSTEKLIERLNQIRGVVIGTT